MLVRGCGKRVKGGLYVCTSLSPNGLPLEHFIIDPPVEYNGENLRSPIIFEREGINHIMMWVGKENYPYASDFIEEVRRFGCSKRIPSDFPIEKLQPGSLMFLVHPRAIITNWESLPAPTYCPKDREDHLSKSESCLGLCYSHTEPNREENQRQIGDTVYPTAFSLDDNSIPEYDSGIFMNLPITNIDHIKDEHGAVNPDIAEKETSIPLYFKDE